MGTDYMYKAWYGMYELTRYCVMDKAGHRPDTGDHSVVSLPLIRLRSMVPFALLAKLRILQPLHRQLQIPRVEE
jgi:hypothetical protein